MADTVDYRDGLRQEALARESLHRYHASSRPLSKDYEYVGLMGEYLFADTYNQPVIELCGHEVTGAGISTSQHLAGLM